MAAFLFFGPLLAGQAQAQTVAFGSSSYTATEDGAGATVMVTMTPAPAAAVNVLLTKTNGTGTTDGDYSGVPSDLAFSPTNTSVTFTVTAASDSKDEPSKSVTLSFGTLPTGVTAGSTATAIVTLVDDDNPPELSIGAASATEGSAITFTVTLSAASENMVTVSYATSLQTGDKAAGSGDFTAESGALTFAAGDTAQTFTVSTTGDSTAEEDETFTVTLSSASNATIPAGGGTATGTINDDDVDPTLSIADASGTEGSAITFTVTLSEASGKIVTVSYATSLQTGDKAAGSGDFTAESGALTFAAGDTAKTFTVNTTDDSNDENDDTFTVTLSGESNATISAAEGTATGTITDNDSAPGLSIADASATEGSAVSFTVTLTAASDNTIMVTYATSVDTAESGDFTAESGTLTFAAGDTAKTFTVSTTEDSTAEENETFTVTLSSASNATIPDPTATGTINDDDVDPTLSIADASGTEGSAVTFTVTLSEASGKIVTVSYATSRQAGDTAESGDFTAASGMLTFAAGDTAQTFTVNTTDDSNDEDDDTFTVTLSGESNATISAAEGTATGTITDNDSAPGLSIADASATEGSAVSFTVTLTAASDNTIMVTYDTSVDTAGSGDFTAASGTLTFSAGDTAQTFTVSTTGDTTDEDNETFTVTLSSPEDATIQDGTATGTINDDDTGPELNIADATGSEGDAILFTVSMSAASGKTVTVSYGTSLQTGDTAGLGDFTAASRTLTFAAGDTAQTFTVSTTEDSTDEDNETFTVTLSNESNATIPDPTATGTIDDDDAPPDLMIGDANGSEGDGIGFTAELSAASGKTVTVSYATSLAGGDTAEAADFAAASGALTFTRGQTTQTVMVSTTEDTTDEDDETFTVTLSSASNAGIQDGTATGTIRDDDLPPTVSIGDASAEEGSAVSFTAELSAASEKTVTVSYATSLESGDTAEAADFAAASGALTFTGGQTTQTVTVSTTEDTTDEDDETFTVTLSSASNAGIQDGTATGTIRDDDLPPTVSIGDASAEEGSAVSFTAELSAPSEKTVTVAYMASVESVDSAKSSDLTGTLTGNLTFDFGETSKTFTVGTLDDSIHERDETFTVTLSNPSNVTIDHGIAVGTINDNDEVPTVTVSLSHNSVAEDSGTAVTVTARLNHASTEVTTVTVTATPVSPAVAGDFRLTANTTLTIPAEQTASTGEVTVAPVDNETDAPHKTVTVAATAQNALAVVLEREPLELELAITDDDPPPVVTLVLGPALIDEMSSSNSTSTVTAMLDRPSSGATTITVTAEAVGPAEAADFALAGSTLTIAAGDTNSSGTVTITAQDNNVDAPDKEVRVSATATNTRGPGGLAGDPSPVTLTIQDDDPAPKATLLVAMNSIRESDDPDQPGDQHVTTVSASLQHPSSETTTITITPLAADFTLSSSGTLTIEAGQTLSAAPVTLTAVDDNVDAPDKTGRTINATAVNTQGVEQPDGVGLTIVDDEPAPVVTLVLSSNAIDENGGPATVMARLSHPSSQDTSVTVGAAAVSPARDSDYGLSGSVLSIPAGDTASTGSATVTPVDNNTDAPDKQVTVSATATNTQGLAGNPEPVTLTIEDDEPAPTVTLSLSPITIPEAGGRSAVTARLSHPSSESTVLRVSAAAVSPAEAADFSLVGSSLNIPVGLVDSAGTVSLTARDNDVDAANKQVTVSAEATNNQGLREGSSDVTTPVTVGPLTLNITDDDARGFVWAPESLTLVEFAQSPFTVALTSEPTEDVTVSLTSSLGRLAEGETSLDWMVPLTLTFTPTNWKVSRYVNYWSNVPGTDTIGLEAAGGDYAGLVGTFRATAFAFDAPATAVVLTVDREEVAEGGGLVTLRVRVGLNGSGRQTETQVSVTVGPGTASADDFTASPASFTATIESRNTFVYQTIALTPTQDGIQEGNETIMLSGTTTASGLTVEPAEVTILDDDMRGITVTPTRLAVDENGSRNYTVVLDSQPSGDVTLTATVSGAGDVTVSPETLTFTATDWQTPKPVTVSAADDADSADGQATVTHAVSGADYGDNNVGAASVQVTVDDDDGRGVVVSTRDLPVREGESATYTVALNSEPTGDVLVRPSVSGDADITVQPASLTFTAADWSAAQTLTVSAANDVDGADDRASVSHAVSGADYGANNVLGPDVFVTASDSGVTLGTANLRLQFAAVDDFDTVYENISSFSLDVFAELTGGARSTPTRLTVLVRGGTASYDDFSATPSAFQLTIPAGRTSGSARLLLTMTNDDVDEDDETIVLTVTSTDVQVPDFVLLLVDDDERGFQVSPPSLTVNEDESAMYLLSLTSEPTGTVTVTPSVSGATEVTVRPEALTFTAADWNRQQTVRVFAARDADGQNDDRAEVTHSASGGDYVDVTGGTVMVEVRDDGVEFEGVRLEVDMREVAEGGGAQTVTVAAILDVPPRPTETEVTVHVGSGTAEEGTDFQEVADFTITIPASGTRAEGTFQLSPVDDITDEGDGEIVIVGGTVADLLVRQTDVTITDNDATSTEVTLTASPDTLAEDADAAAQVVTVTAALDAGARVEDTEVSLSLSGVTAARGADFEAVSVFTLTIPANVTSGEETFTLTPVDDRVDEPDETVRLTGRAFGLSVEPAAGLEITIEDNENTPQATLVLTPDEVGENGGVSRVTAVLDLASSSPTTITISTAPGPDTQAADFDQSGTALTIPAGTTGSTGTVEVRPVDNRELQTATRTVTVSGVARNDLAVTAPADVTLTITDDESPSTRAILSASPALAAEGRTTRVTVTATLNGTAREGDTVYNMQVSAQTATEGDDFAAVPAFTLTIEAGRTSGTAGFDLQAVDDDTDEPDETVRVHAVAAPFPLEETFVTITDEPPPPTSVTLALSPERVAEGAAADARTVTVTATLAGQPRAEATAVTVSVSGGTATAGGDFAAVADFAVTIAAGQASGTGRFTLTPVDDAVDEADETVVVTGGGSGVSVAPSGGVVVTITDDDERGVTATPAALAVLKGGEVSYRIALSSQPTAAVTVEVSSGNPAVTAAPARLIFEPGRWNAAQTVTVTAAVGDAVADNTAVALRHTVSGGDYGENGVTLGPVTVTVTQLRAALTVSPARVAEGDVDDARTVTVTVTLEGEPRTEDTEVTVAVSGGTATEGEDFAAVADFMVTIAADETSGSGSFVLAPVDDAVDESDETVLVAGTAAGLAAPAVVVTITDDDERGVTATPAALAVLKGGEVSYRISLSSQPTAAVTVEVSSGNPAVTAAPARLIFEPGRWDAAQTVTVTAAVGDAVADNTAVELRHTVSGGDYGENGVTLGPVTVTVTQLRAALTVSPARVAEGATGSARAVAVTVTLEGEPRTEATEVTVAVTGGTATEGEDFAAVADFMVTIAADETSGTSSFVLAPVDDAVDESDETVLVAGTAAGLAAPAVVVTITDDDERGVTATPAALAVLKGGEASYRISLSSQPTAAVTVEVSSGNPAVTAAPARLIFEPGRWNAAQTVTVTAAVGDAVADNTAVELTHTVSGGDYGENGVTLGPVTVTVTQLRAALTVSPARVAEGATGSARAVAVTVTLEGERTEDTEVTVAVSGGTATEGEDFATVADFMVTIAAGETSGTSSFVLSPVDDAVDESDETVLVAGTAAGLAASAVPVTITDDDERGVTATPAALAVLKGGEVSYRISLSSQPTAAVTVEVSSGNPAVTAAPARLIFEPGRWNAAQTVTVTAAVGDAVADNTAVELRHTVSGGDYGENGVTLGPVTVTVTQLRAALTVSPARVAEGATGSARAVAVTVTLEGEPRTEDTEVTVAVSGGTATEGEDFAAVADFMVTIAADETSGTSSFVLAPVDDAVDESDETVLVAGTAAGLAAPAVVVTITDDDERGVTATPAALAVLKGGEASYRISLSSQPTAAVTVEVSSGNPAVTAAPARLIFEPGRWNAAQTVTVTAAVGDAVADNTAVELTHTVSGGDYGENGVTLGPVTVTVTQLRAALTVSPARVAEGDVDDARTVTVTVTLEGEPRTEDTEVTVTVTGGTATEGEDFAAVADFMVTIAAGETSGSGSFVLTPVDDAVDEADETVLVAGTAAGLAAPAVPVTITDDDERGVTATPAALAVLKGGEVSYRISLSSQPTAAVTVEVSSGNPAVTAAPARLIFEPGGWDAAQTVTVTAGDAVADNTAVELRHTVSGGDYGENGVTLGPVTVTVTQLRAALTVSPARVAEGATGSARAVAVTVTLEGEPRTEDTEVTVAVSGGTATATEGEDFAAVADFVVTISAGETSGSGSFVLAPVDDAVDESDETVLVAGTAAGLAAPAVPVTITDDDERGVTATPAALAVLAVLKGGEASYRISLSSQPTAAVTVEVSSGNPAVTAAPARLIFEPGRWDAAQTVTVTAGDAVADNTAVELTHTVSGGDYGENGVTLGPVTVTVTQLRAALTVTPARVAEGATGSARTVAVTVTLEGEPRTEDTEVTVAVSGGTATEGEDFAAVADFMVTIAAGETSGSGSFVLTPVDDAVDESDETVLVAGTASGLAASAVPVTITDDDERGVTATPAALAVLKGGEVSYRISLSSQPTAAVTVEVSSGNPAVTAAPARLIFEPGRWNAAQTVTVTAGDAVADNTAVELTHTVSGGDYGENGVTLGPVTVTVTQLRAALTVSPARVAEGATGSARAVAVTVTLEGERTEDTEVTVTVTGGTATEGEDFEAVEDFVVTVSGGETSGSGSFVLAPVDDAVDESDETVLVAGTGSGLAAPAVVVTITDDDERGVTATPAALAVLKGGEASYRISLSSQPTAAVTVEVSSGNPAVTAAPARLIFEPGRWDAAQTVTVTAGDAVADNMAVELRHTVSGGDYGENGVTLGPVTVTVTQLRAALTVSPARVAEGATGSARAVAVTVTLEGEPRTEDTAVTVAVSGGTATEGEDFAAVADFVVTISAGETSGSGSFVLAPVDDAVDESDETVLVAGTASGLAAPAVVVTITDDDERGVTVMPTALTVPEGGGGAYEVSLASQPTSNVTVTVVSDDSEVTVDRSSLTFTASSWSTAQTVTVSARDDELVEDDATARLIHAVSGDGYGSVAVDAVTVTVPGHEVDGMAATFKIPATGEVAVPDGTPLPGGARLTLPAALAREEVVLTAVATAPALSDPPRGFNAGDAVVDIELGGGMALGAGQTATVCLPVPGGGRGRVYRYDESLSPPEWVQLAEPSGGSPAGLACGVTDRFSLFTVGSAPNEAVAQGWLGRFGRLAAQHVVDALQDRMEAKRTAGVAGTLAGQGVVAEDGETPASVVGGARAGSELQALRGRIEAGSGWAEEEFSLKPRSLTVSDLVSGTRFSLTGATAGGGTVGLWGRGALSRFTGREGDATIEGDVTTATLGADWTSGSLLAGLALSHSRGAGFWQRDDGKDDVESSLTGVHPYFAYEVTDRLSVWGTAGYGRGELTMPDGSRTIEADIDMTMTAAGARSDLMSAGSTGGPALSLKVDGLYLRIGSEAAAGLEAVEADVSRLRLGVEGSWAMEDGSGGKLTPSVEIGVRHDWGDVETGTGVDVGGGLTYSDPGRRVTASVRARGLVAHKAEDFDDWGVSGALGLDLDPSSERGFTVSLRQSVGSSASDGMDALFRRDSLADLAGSGNADAGGRLEAETAYGFGILGDRFTGTPYFKYGLTRTGRDYTLGWRLTPVPATGLDMEFRAGATRRETGGEGEPGYGVALEARLRW